MSQYSNHLFTPGSQNNSWSHLNNYIKTKARVLDVGCSSGNFGEALRHIKGCEVIGIDLDDADIKLAKKVLDNALVMDINDDSLYKKLGLFDIIIFADVIEHLIDPRTTLAKVKKLLAPGGVVIFSVPHMAHISVRLQLMTGEFPYKNRGLLDRTHLHFYDANEIESVFTDAGYEIEDMNPVVSGLTDKQYTESLNKLGLKYTPQFKKIMDKNRANVFQFVGMAKPTNKKNTSRRNLEYRMPQDDLFDMIQKSSKRVAELEADNYQLRESLQTVRAELNSKIYKLPTYVRRAVVKIKQKPKNS